MKEEEEEKKHVLTESGTNDQYCNDQIKQHANIVFQGALKMQMGREGTMIKGVEPSSNHSVGPWE